VTEDTGRADHERDPLASAVSPVRTRTDARNIVIAVNTTTTCVTNQRTTPSGARLYNERGDEHGGGRSLSPKRNPSAADRSARREFTNCVLATGTRNAHDPIMIKRSRRIRRAC
jgi:hypothetical protein